MQGWKMAYRPTGQSRDGKVGRCGRAESGARKGLGASLLGCVGGARFGIAVPSLRLRGKTLARGHLHGGDLLHGGRPSSHSNPTLSPLEAKKTPPDSWITPFHMVCWGYYGEANLLRATVPCLWGAQGTRWGEAALPDVRWPALPYMWGGDAATCRSSPQ